MNLTDSVAKLKGVGKKKEEALNRAGIYNLKDMLMVFPKAYEDRRKPLQLEDTSENLKSLVSGKVIWKKPGNRYRKSPLTIGVTDGTDELKLIFFNGRFVEKALNIGEEYVFFGKVEKTVYGYQMIHPDFVKEGSKEDIRGIVPVYPDIKGIYQREFRNWQRTILENIDLQEDIIPEAIRKDYKLADMDYAMRNIHFPQTGHQVLACKYRFIFQEFLLLETGLLYMNSEYKLDFGHKICGSAGDKFGQNLPFKLTKGQVDAWKDIKSDLESGRIMNRLLQGDVGSGKTVIAEMAMVSAADSGFQAVIMAPTEILAKQHYELMKKDFAKLGIETALLTSSVKGEEKKLVLDGIQKGSIQVLSATHAVIQDNVKFKNLGLVITDEQHRFGVEQRQLLSSKGEKVDTLVMTATPIPRTLAVILYGDLDISKIETMPSERKAIKTYSGGKKDRNRIYQFVREEMERGSQCYVVTPLIDQSEKIEAKSATEVYEELKEKFIDYNVALLHGNMNRDEKNQIMKLFSEGKIDILVSTVIIEVGINVRNASVMVIENAERFGLAQLHQLRGRVGRGDRQSYCFLISDKETEVSRKRVETMKKTNSGFVIAEEDLKLRGPGEMLGIRQHGLPELRYANLLEHGDVLVKALEAAKRIVDSDPRLVKDSNQGIYRELTELFGRDISINL